MELINLNQTTIEQIRANYLELAKKLHPDLNKSDPKAKEKFQELQKAYNLCISSFKNQNVYTFHVTISLEESFLGCERFCLSSDRSKYFLLKIDKGIQDKHILTYNNIQIEKNKFGTLRVKVNVELSNNYKIKNNKLMLIQSINFLKLFFGSETVIIGPDGSRIKVRIPKRTKSGSIFEIKNEGFFDNLSEKRNGLLIQFISTLFS